MNLHQVRTQKKNKFLFNPHAKPDYFQDLGFSSLIASITDVISSLQEWSNSYSGQIDLSDILTKANSILVSISKKILN